MESWGEGRPPRRVHIIAEMASSHDGSLENAMKIVCAAGEAGADAIQLQIWRADNLVVPHHPDLAKLRGLELDERQWTELVAFTRKRFPAVEIIAGVHDNHAVDFARGLGIDIYKIPAAELANYGLLHHAAMSARRIDLGVGASGLEEIQDAIEFLAGQQVDEIWLMYGYRSYPTAIEEIHLEFMRKIGQLFELPIGYQDHCDAEHEAAFWIPAAAIGMGIDIIEKHVTHDRSRRGDDHEHEVALNPDEFARFVRMVRAVEQSRGSSLPRPFSEGQERYRSAGVRTLVASKDLPEGRRLESDDFIPLRSVDAGLTVESASEVIGRVVRRTITAFSPIRNEDLI